MTRDRLLQARAQPVPPIDLNDVRLLAQVVEHGNYTAAARATGVAKSTISQRICALERAAGNGLLRRNSRSLSLTEAGALLMPHARAIEHLAQSVERDLLEGQSELRGTLLVSCSPVLACIVLSGLVARFLAAHPSVAIRIEAAGDPILRIAAGADMVIDDHSGRLRDCGLTQRVVARTEWALAASPAWLAANPAPAVPGDILVTETLCHASTRTCPPWILHRGEDERVVAVGPRLVSDDIATLHAAALAGAGLACLPAYVLAPSLSAGELHRVLPDWSPASTDLVVLTPPRLQTSRLARAFADFLATELRA